jgi:hypothetical protein
LKVQEQETERQMLKQGGSALANAGARTGLSSAKQKVIQAQVSGLESGHAWPDTMTLEIKVGWCPTSKFGPITDRAQ